MTSARPIPFSAKARRQQARAALAARCVAVQPARDLLPWHVFAAVTSFLLVLL